MKKNKAIPMQTGFEKFAYKMTLWTGRPATFVTACAIILSWLASGPVFGYSDTWQLVINTGTTIITFLMVFLIQQTQNKDAHSIQLKLNELIAATNGASNRLINVEDLSEEELENLHRFYTELSRLAKRDKTQLESHSIEEARVKHETKVRKRDVAKAAKGPGGPEDFPGKG